MQIFNGFLLYFMTWLVIWFMILPWKSKPLEQALEGVAPRGAQASSLKRKCCITTLAAFFLWCLLFYLMPKALHYLKVESKIELNLMLKDQKKDDS